jgi:hypothetical protein
MKKNKIITPVTSKRCALFYCRKEFYNKITGKLIERNCEKCVDYIDNKI